jgi:hypothetical protein
LFRLVNKGREEEEDDDDDDDDIDEENERAIALFGRRGFGDKKCQSSSAEAFSESKRFAPHA